MIFNFLSKTIKYGKLEIIDYDQKRYIFGSTEPFCTIKFHNKDVKRNLFINPELYVGEAYVEGDLTIEKGNLEKFVDIITKNYSNIKKDVSNTLYKSIEFFLNYKLNMLAF